MQQSGNANFHQQTVKQSVKWTCARKVKNCITVRVDGGLQGLIMGAIQIERQEVFIGSDFG